MESIVAPRELEPFEADLKSVTRALKVIYT
jgi:hypothetical protein